MTITPASKSAMRCVVMAVVCILASALDAHQHFIVSFHAFCAVTDLERVVRNALGATPFRFNFRARVPHAHTAPTDFVVLSTSHPGAVAILESNAAVRRVYPDAETRAKRTLLDVGGDAGVSGRTSSGLLHPFGVGELWAQGLTGRGVKVAVFDSGVANGMERLATVADRTDWTGQGVDGDTVGHGTFVSGIIGGRHDACPGIAPDAQLYIMRLFTHAQLSYTSWFLDAFNYALHVGIDVLNLSVGGPDYADLPFIDKVNELVSEGVHVVSAIGNDGPRWGTLNSPADLIPVVGVGGIEPDGRIAVFSSRGSTWHHQPVRGYGRMKPDIVTYARNLVAPSHKDLSTCKTLSGTSVATPIVAGAIALILSVVPPERRKRVANPAAVKRALMQSAKQLSKSSIYEQGAGLLDVPAAVDVMRSIDAEFLRFEKRCSEMRNGRETVIPVEGIRPYLFPETLNLAEERCELMWPHCAQPLVVGNDWHTFNITVLNLAGVNGRIADTRWLPHRNSRQLDVAVSLPERFWPWGAGLGLHLRASSQVRVRTLVQGVLRITVTTDMAGLCHANSEVNLPIRVIVAPSPPRERRLLFDIYHSIRYPPGYVPRDSLIYDTKDMLDWLGDHPHTNYGGFMRALRNAGYFVDVLDAPLHCSHSESLGRRYGALLLFDVEDYFFADERRIILDAVTRHGLSLIVAAEWDDPRLFPDLAFNDDNTRSRWTPIVGGANLHALNALLLPFRIAFGPPAIYGDLDIDGLHIRIDAGAPIVSFPANGEVVSTLVRPVLTKAERAGRTGNPSHDKIAKRLGEFKLHVVLGIAFFGKGTVVALSDTHFMDDAFKGDSDGLKLLLKLLGHVLKPSFPRQALFFDSHILRHAMHIPTPQSGLLDAATFSLFRPHSRVLASDATSHHLGERNVTTICARYNSLLEHVRVESPRFDDIVEVSARPRAELLRSDTKYFTLMSDAALVRLASHSGRRWARRSVQSSVIACWIGLFLGFTLIVLALVTPAWKNRSASGRMMLLRVSLWNHLRRIVVRHGANGRAD